MSDLQVIAIAVIIIALCFVCIKALEKLEDQ